MNMKYYVINNRILPGDLDPDLFNYQMLNSEQVEFYLANPKASAQEVLDMELIPIYVPTLEDAIRMKVDYYSRMSFENRERLIPEYKLVNASLGIYDEAETHKIQNIVISFRNEFYRLKTLCEACTSIEQLDSIHDEYGSITITI